jgi:ADP-heptose:LPS heptosyltransferase
MSEPERILVIKHGALGDFVQALGPFQAIRAHHMGAHIVLLTTTPFVSFATASGLFDEVWVDDRPKFWQIGEWVRLRKRLRQGRFRRVYDLQTSDRSSMYFHFFPRRRRPEWSGIARGCSHPHNNPDRDFMHTLDCQAEQLEMAGIRYVPPPDLSWVTATPERFHSGGNFILLVAGGSAHRPAKRWPEEAFAKLARLVAADAVTPVLIGKGPNEAALAHRIVGGCADAIDLVDRTDLADLVALGRNARAAVGNDSGPMHLFAAAGCPSLVLFSDASDPHRVAPRGPKVKIIRRVPLAALSVDEVAASLANLWREAPAGLTMARLGLPWNHDASSQ